MNNVFFNDFKNQTFNQDGIDNSILKLKLYNPSNLKFHYLPVKGIITEVEVIRMRSGYIFDTLTSVDIQESVKMGGKVNRFFESVIYQKTLRYHLLVKL